VLSGDLTAWVSKRHQDGKLRKLRLEDVSVGLWMRLAQESGIPVNRESFPGMGCTSGYHIHEMTQNQMRCLWENEQKLLVNDTDSGYENICCGCADQGGLMGLGR